MTKPKDMKLFKVPSKGGDDGDEPQDWNVIKVVASSDNEYQIEFINKRYYYSDAFVDLEAAVPGFRSMLHSDFIKQPNLVDMSTIKGRWLLTCHFSGGSGYESQQPVKVWEVGDAQEAVLLLKALEDIKFTEYEEYNFHISKKSEYIDKSAAVEEMKEYLKEQATE